MPPAWSAPRGWPSISAAPDVKVVDATWYLPTLARDAKAEYAAAPHPGRGLSSTSTTSPTPASPLPHMLPDPVKFSSRVRRLGLGDGTRIVVYDANRYSASARVWWMFRVFGHADVAVLDGGLAKWQAEGRPLDDRPVTPREAHFTARHNHLLVRDLEQLRSNLVGRREQVVDARPAGRFRGTEPEPRPGLRAGHIPQSLNLPHLELIAADGTLRPPAELRRRVRRDRARPRAAGRHDLRLGRHRLHRGAGAAPAGRRRRRGLRRLLVGVGRPQRHPGRELSAAMAARPAVVGSVETVVTYLEMTAPPPTAPLRAAARRPRDPRRPRSRPSRSTAISTRRSAATGPGWSRRLLSDEELAGDPRRSRGRGERAVGRPACRPATPSSTVGRRPTSSSPISACCPSSSARGSAATCSTGRSATPGARGPRRLLRRHLRSRPPARARRLPKVRLSGL